MYVLLFLLLFSLTESPLMRYHLISYDRKPLIYQSVLLNYIRIKHTSMFMFNFFAKHRAASAVLEDLLASNRKIVDLARVGKNILMRR